MGTLIKIDDSTKSRLMQHKRNRLYLLPSCRDKTGGLGDFFLSSEVKSISPCDEFPASSLIFPVSAMLTSGSSNDVALVNLLYCHNTEDDTVQLHFFRTTKIRHTKTYKILN